ncbi:M48 family metalloprotease [Haliea sp. E1-2-M8]|uniref:M48 family metalloprotease n=1 Tax=Haliea sp. E1-2-M8 TaxID=3064706 RepID=UPI00272644D7|nr:M48 family metalloprotease [Haliea sp. E1-2-M8]MDO8860398.1 M48 family metalloprotease [Haliea sp. E1-2-M8]
MNRLAIIFLVLSLAGCAVNPVTGDRQLALVSEAQEIQIGREVAGSAEQQFGLVKDDELQAYIQQLGDKMASASERPDLPWTFRVVDEPTPNAFAAPGGFIYFTRGLLAMMRNEAELVTVLGHEIGHVTARHSVTMMSRSQLAQLGIGIGSILSPTVAQFGDLAASGLQLLFLKYGRDAERQADDLGYRYALEQGYDVREMVNVFAALQKSAELAGQSPVPSWMASHPYPEERIQRINQQLASLPPSTDRRIGEDEFLQRIDGLDYGDNPRQGFFDGNRFLHPDLAFRLDFPQGWLTQNQSRAVVAGSPEEDAIIQMTVVPGSLKEAANAFFSQQGMKAGRIGSQKVNGLPAISGNFEMQTEQAKLGGAVTFVELEGRTYRILGYTPAQQRAKYDKTFRASMNSFARLTNAKALNKQPLQLSIVRVPRKMTLEAFNKSYPSAIPIEELALINQLQGPGDTMPANFRAKRVTEAGT